MTNEQRGAIYRLDIHGKYAGLSNGAVVANKADIDAVLSLIKEKDAELEKKDKIINSTITEIENLRQYFSEDLQPDFIRILEILKDKKVIDW